MGGGVGGWIKCTTQLLLFIWHNLNRQSRGLSKAGSAGGQSIERQERHSPPPPFFKSPPEHAQFISETIPVFEIGLDPLTLLSKL